MRCEECRTLVEEYFDGELERSQSERVSAHLSACADCAAALDALGFEQELYLRYERELEVSPALWQNVRAAVARLDEEVKEAEPLPRPAGLRGRLAAALSLFAPRPALASSLALLVVGLLAGALWLAPKRTPQTTGEVATETTGVGRIKESAVVAPAPVVPHGTSVAKGVDELVDPSRGARVPETEAAANPAAVKFVNANAATPGRLAAVPPPPAADHHAAEDDGLLPLAPDAPAGEADVILAANARLLTPEEKEMARHLEQAQMLLRSFQNAAAPEGDAVQLAFERRLSRKLLEENETLRLEADTSGDEGSKQVLDTLEPFLLDIANLRDNASRDEVRSIKERMKKTEIIAALHVY